MKKSKAKSTKLQPFITLKKERIQPVKLEESFAYLGKNFNFNMNCDERKTELKSEVLKYILTIDKLPLKCRSKIDIVQRYVFSKLKGRFSVYNTSETQIPISGNITHLSLPKKMLGFNIKTARQIRAQCKFSVRRILKTSRNEKIRICITLPAATMLNLILFLNLLEYLKAVKLNSTLRKLYRSKVKNLHGTVSLISTNKLE